MEKVTVPEGERRIAFFGASAAAALIDLFGVAVLLGAALRLTSPVLSFQVRDVLEGILAISAFTYAFFAHRGWAVSVGRWCVDIKRYSYAQIQEYTGKGSLFVHGISTRYERFIRTACVVIVIYATAVIAGGR